MACTMVSPAIAVLFFFNDTATTEIYTLSLHDALPISGHAAPAPGPPEAPCRRAVPGPRSEEHTSELQSHHDIVCRLLLEKKKREAEYEQGIQSDQRMSVQGYLTAFLIGSAQVLALLAGISLDGVFFF